MPAGEYVVISNGDSYIELASDSTGNFSSIIANDVFKNRSVITVQDGQYLKVQRGTIYAAKDAPKVELKDGMLPSCMYKVGIDFPAGEYKVTSNGGDSYIEVSRDSSHNMSSIISNDLFTGDRYIQVSDGQYLKILQLRSKNQIRKKCYSWKINCSIFNFSFTLALAATAFAHPGRTDSNGGHWDRRTGTYHKH